MGKTKPVWLIVPAISRSAVWCLLSISLLAVLNERLGSWPPMFRYAVLQLFVGCLLEAISWGSGQPSCSSWQRPWLLPWSSRSS